MVNIKIRGIYSTALTKLMIDNDFGITYPTEVIRERLNLEPRYEVPDVEIFDNIIERQGVVVLGKEKGVKKIKEIMREEFEDAIIRNSESGWNSVWRGRVIKVDSTNRSAILDFRLENLNFQGVLENYECKEGDNLVVSVKFPSFKYIRAQLSPNITISGDYAILIETKTPLISRKIVDEKRRKELLEIANSMKLVSDKWKVLWRTSADKADNSVLKEELNYLNSKLKEVLEKKDDETIIELYKGLPGFYIEFPAESKKRLDEIRGEVLETVKGHHQIKSIGNDYSMLIDFVEVLLEKTENNKDNINETFNEFTMQNFIKASRIGIEHVKLDGRVFRLTSGSLIEVDKKIGKFILKRYFKGTYNKLYDGLKVPIEEGDYGITEMKAGEYYYNTSYYNKNNELKGIYYNINTPLEVYQNTIRYVDLEVDVIKMPDGKIKVEDKELLDKFYIEGFISLALKEKAMKTVKEIIEKLKSG
ncbi:MAG: DUF402 domain-containing protein [Candidatus Helarchaeota archaeon]